MNGAPTPRADRGPDRASPPPVPSGDPSARSPARTAAVRARNAAFWSAAAPAWAHQAERHDTLAAPLGSAAMDLLAVAPGDRVVDLGCGCGGTAAELARRASPGGQALGVDLSPGMIECARRRFPRRRHPGLSFIAADLETLETVPGQPFDAAYSRMTLMLLADPVAGCALVRRALRPGGRFAATVFGEAAAHPWMHAALLGAAPALTGVPPLPVGLDPGPFALADPVRLRRVLADAGFDDIGLQRDDVALEAPDDPDGTAEWLIEIGPAGGAYRRAEADQQAAARRGAARLLDRFRRPGRGFRFTAAIWTVTAR